MDLYTIQHELIAGDRDAEDWHVIRGRGPIGYHHAWTYGTGPGREPYSYVSSDHHGHAVCRLEPCLTMSWGMDRDDDARNLTFSWTEEFVDQAVRASLVDFFWNNALIDRVTLLSRDGGHGLKPFVGEVNRTVTDFELAVANLVHGLNNAAEEDAPEGYLREIGASVGRDDERRGAGSS